MNDYLLIERNGQEALFFEHPVKMTALLYLREVLQKQQFDECDDIICIARAFGAQDQDIDEIIEGYFLETSIKREG